MTSNTLLDRLIRFSLEHRALVLGLAAVLLIAGGIWTTQVPVDVLPDLSAPVVTVVTESPGLAPEEVEVLVTFPIESALGGAPNVRRVRSVSADGISVIWVEFRWGAEVYRARQIVTERLQRVELPERSERPELGPISSIMGEITFIALTAEDFPALELRRLAETVVRRTLLAIPGISQVVPIGGEVRQFEIVLDPAALARHRVSLDEVLAAAEAASQSPAAGFHVDSGKEFRVRGLGRVRRVDELAATVVRDRVEAGGVPLTLDDLGRLEVGPEPARGTASYNGRPAVILSVQKQPTANTVELTAEIDRVLAQVQGSLPSEVVIETENFRQADFIEVAIHNVSVALRDGAVLVVIVLFLFLGQVRTTFISALAIPLSLVVAVGVIWLLGGTLNTMTLGGLAIAIGALVDDAIIDVENVFRRLRQNADRPPEDRRPVFEVVFLGSSEVRKAILFATLLIVLVFLPLFFLPGVEGRLLRPLGLAYVVALAASLLVSMTVTPVLCYLLLPRRKILEAREPWLMRSLRRAYRPSLEWSLEHPRWVLLALVLTVAAALALLPGLGRSFLPPFNEGSLTVSAVAPAGISLEESDRLGRQVEEELLSFPEVVSTSRRTGRAERDEHVLGVHASEIEVVLTELEGEEGKNELLAELRRRMAGLPGLNVSFGQPISHRIDHMISGSRTNLAVKVFGPDLAVLRSLASQVHETLGGVEGIVDLSNQEQASVPQLLIDFDRRALARHGLSAELAARSVEALFQGAEVGEVIEGGLVSRVVVRFPEELRHERERLERLPVAAPGGDLLRLADVAEIRFDLGPSLIRRENVQRLAMVTANVAGADLAGTVERARAAIESSVELPPEYLVRFGGQFEEAISGVRTLGILTVLILFGMYALLYVAFRDARHALIVLVNLPLALVGGVFAVALAEGVLSIATLVGFITLFGIAARNGVLLVTHYQHLIEERGVSFGEAVRRGSEERLAPILMTALTAGLALVPLVLAGGESGNEIQSPMAQVILGGLSTSTFLNLIVVPILFMRWGRRAPREAR